MSAPFGQQAVAVNVSVIRRRLVNLRPIGHDRLLGRCFAELRLMKLAAWALLFMVSGTANAVSPPDAICGRWLTEDKQGVIHIYLEPSGKLAGRIVSGPRPNESDVKNSDPTLRERPLLGVKLMYSFVRGDDGVWREGSIYDGNEGKVYKANVRLKDSDKNRLLLRGYIGMPLLGRTAEWTRETPSAADACNDPIPARGSN